MAKKPTKKVFAVHRVFGRYEVDGTITCIPAPRPGLETLLIELAIDERVENMVKDKMVSELFAPAD